MEKIVQRKSPNFGRGFFRLWLVLSAIFIGSVALISFEDIRTEFAKSDALSSAATRRLKTEKDKYLLPVLCVNARGELSKDYTLSAEKGPGPWDKYAKVNPFDTCWYSVATFRNHYSEYADLSDAEVYWKLNEQNLGKMKAARPWQLLRKTGLIAFGFPLGFLVLGSLVGWVFSGFARRSNV